MADPNTLEVRIVAEVGEVTAALSEVAQQLRGLAPAFASVQSAATAAAAAFNAVGQSSATSATAGERFIASLERQVATFGQGKIALLEYDAAQKGVAEAAAPLIAQLDEAMTAHAGKAAAEKEDAAALTELSASMAQIGAQQDAYIAGLREQVAQLSLGAQAYARYKAEQLGVAETAGPLLATIRELTVAQEAEAAAQRDAAVAGRELGAAQAQAAAEAAATARTNQAFMASLREQVAVYGQARSGVLSYRAAQLGLSQEAAPLIGQLRELEAAEAGAGGAARGAAFGIREMGVAAHGSRGALYELTVIMHELSAGRMRQALSSTTILLQKLAVPLSLAAGFAISATAALAFARDLGESVKKYEELRNQSETLGLSVNDLQTLGAAAQELGIKEDQAFAAVGRLDQSFARARMGAKQQTDALGALGVNLKQNYTQSQLLQRVLEGWDKLGGDGPRKVAIATELLGRNGRELIPVLDALAGHWDEQNKKLDEYGVHNAQAIQNGIALSQEFRDLGERFQGLGATLMASMGPALIDFMKGLGEAITNLSKFIKEANDPASQLHQTLDQVRMAVIALAGAILTNFVAEAIPALITGLGEAAIALGLLDKEAALGVLGEGTLIAKVGLLGTAFRTLATGEGIAAAATGALDAVLAISPIFLIAAAIGGIIYAVELWTSKTKEQQQAQESLNSAVSNGRDIDENLSTMTKEATQAAIDHTTALINEAQANLNDASAALENAEAQDRKALSLQNILAVGPAEALGEKIGLDHVVGKQRQAVATAMAALEADMVRLEQLKQHLKVAKPAAGGTTAGDPFKANKDKHKDHTAEIEAELKKELDDRQLYGDAALKYEEHFWEVIKATAKKGSAEERAAIDHLRQIHEELHREGIEADKASAGGGADPAIEARSKAQIDAIEAQIQAVKDSVRDRTISEKQGAAEEIVLLQQKLRAQLQAISDELDAETAANAVKAALDKDNVAEFSRDMAAQHAALQDFMAKRLALVAAEAKQEQEIGDKTRSDELLGYEKFFTKVGDGWRKTIEGLVSGHLTWAQVFGRITAQAFDFFLQGVERLVVKWAAAEWMKVAATSQGAAIRAAIENSWLGTFLGIKTAETVVHTGTEIKKTAATVTGAAIRTGAEVTAAATSGTVGLLGAVKMIMADAGKAAAGVYASASHIPFIGWIVAPALAAAAFAAVAAFATFSAAGGFGDVPFDNAATMLHKNEMVLPATLANPLRAMLTSGGVHGPGAGTTGSATFHFSPTIHAHTSPSLEELLTKESNAAQKWFQNQVRNNGVRARPRGR